MASRTHVDGKEKAGTHTSLTEASAEAWSILKKAGAQRVSAAHITGGICAKSHSIKIQNDGGALKLIVVTPSTKQEIYIYGVSLEVALSSLKRELKGKFFLKSQ